MYVGLFVMDDVVGGESEETFTCVSPFRFIGNDNVTFCVTRGTIYLSGRLRETACDL